MTFLVGDAWPSTDKECESSATGTSQLGEMRRLMGDNLMATAGVTTLAILDSLKMGFECGNGRYG